MIQALLLSLLQLLTSLAKTKVQGYAIYIFFNKVGTILYMCSINTGAADGLV